MTAPPGYFKADDVRAMESIAGRYPMKASAIMPLLHFIQGKKKSLAEEDLVFVADLLEVPHVRAFEVATYYTMFFTEPMGRHLVQICRSMSCSINGSDEVLEALEKELGIKVGQTTPDNAFSLVEVECIGACDQAPALMVDADLYRQVSADGVGSILESYRQKA
ncbi:MAG: NADH-quinone oxidoreductase subunit NuoE [Deltaproteobacteria bacterium]|nr:NADH-quinone oxidoreductase subunit NuoE [Deltaproteobacteria bacterium]